MSPTGSRPDVARRHLVYGSVCARRADDSMPAIRCPPPHDMLDPFGLEAFAYAAPGIRWPRAIRARKRSADTRYHLAPPGGAGHPGARNRVSEPKTTLCCNSSWCPGGGNGPPRRVSRKVGINSRSKPPPHHPAEGSENRHRAHGVLSRLSGAPVGVQDCRRHDAMPRCCRRLRAEAGTR
jgi:hypothetical protein